MDQMIREATYADIGGVVGLLQQLWPQKRIDYDRMREVIERYIGESRYGIYVCEEESGLVGVVTVSFRWALYYEGEAAIVEDLVVDEACRGRGIGSRLVSFVEDGVTRDRGLKAIEISSDFHREPAHGFWDKHGYVRRAYQFRKPL